MKKNNTNKTNMKNFRQIFIIVILLLAILKPTLAQEREIATTQEGLSNSEVTFQLNIQVLAHNYKGWTTPITGMGKGTWCASFPMPAKSTA